MPDSAQHSAIHLAHSGGPVAMWQIQSGWWRLMKARAASDESMGESARVQGVQRWPRRVSSPASAGATVPVRPVMRVGRGGG